MNFFDDFSTSERDRHLAAPVLSAWALQVAALIDAESPGFLRFLIQTGGGQRHVVLAALASVNERHPVGRGTCIELSHEARTGLRVLGDALQAWRPREALANTFDLPDRFEGLGVFTRLVEPLQPRDYLALVAVLRDPAQRRRRRALQHVQALDHDRLRGVLALKSPLCTVRLARKVRRESQAQIANDVLAMVQMHRSDLDDEMIFEFCGQGDPLAPFSAQLERLLGLISELPPLTLDIPRGFRHLRSRKDFEDCGRRFRNCIATKFLPEALTGRVAYLEYIPRPAIAVLLPTSAGLMLSKVHAPGNFPPPPDLVEAVRSSLAASWIGYITPAPVKRPEASVRFALMRYDPFAMGPDEFEAAAPELD